MLEGSHRILPYTTQPYRYATLRYSSLLYPTLPYPTLPYHGYQGGGIPRAPGPNVVSRGR